MMRSVLRRIFIRLFLILTVGVCGLWCASRTRSLDFSATSTAADGSSRRIFQVEIFHGELSVQHTQTRFLAPRDPPQQRFLSAITVRKANFSSIDFPFIGDGIDWLFFGYGLQSDHLSRSAFEQNRFVLSLPFTAICAALLLSCAQLLDRWREHYFSLSRRASRLAVIFCLITGLLFSAATTYSLWRFDTAILTFEFRNPPRGNNGEQSTGFVLIDLDYASLNVLSNTWMNVRRTWGSAAPMPWYVDRVRGKYDATNVAHAPFYRPANFTSSAPDFDLNAGGFQTFLIRRNRGSGGFVFDLGLPLPAAAVAAFIYPTIVGILTLRRRRRRIDGQILCQHCGYDLRASESRCPECGKVFSA